MKIIIGSKSMEIKDAINTLQSNIRWLKRKLIVVSSSSYGKHFTHFYTQKIEAQEALIACLAKYDATYNLKANRQKSREAT